MTGSWKAEQDGLAHHWPEDLSDIRNRPAWLGEAPDGDFCKSPSCVPEFAAHSPMGSGEWIAPWKVRWSLPERY